VGLIQATEVCKLVLGRGEPLIGRLLLYDALAMRFSELEIRRDPECPVCGDARSIHAPIDYYQFCGLPGHGQPVRLFDAEIDPEQLKEKLDAGQRILILDVREPHEHEINQIDQARLIPLGDLPARVNELDTADEIVVHCLSGVRSAQACQFLRQAGFAKVSNLRGGIRAWIDRVDPSLPQY
jgi:adenylyltransferase/sulfurtransferase